MDDMEPPGSRPGLGPTATEQNQEARIHVFRKRAEAYQAWLSRQIGAFPVSAHSAGSDEMAARAIAHFKTLFGEVI